jgi:hypothetical protein
MQKLLIVRLIVVYIFHRPRPGTHLIANPEGNVDKVGLAPDQGFTFSTRREMCKHARFSRRIATVVDRQRQPGRKGPVQKAREYREIQGMAHQSHWLPIRIRFLYLRHEAKAGHPSMSPRYPYGKG